ncbi:MAG: GNAT family N-acetyltransferase [Marinilabiliaceae bacterium]
MDVVQADLNRKEHKRAFEYLLDAYSRDEMGMAAPMEKTKVEKVIADLQGHPSYTGFFVIDSGRFLALANCFVNYSTFRARHLVNIHDFIVAPEYRQKGAGLFLLQGIERYARDLGCCRINLEVREDNVKARRLYRKFGFSACKPPMLFWEKNL